MDPSEQCGYSFAMQLSLFESIRPLFSNKPLIIAINKIDVAGLDSLTTEYQERLETLRKEGVQVMCMSTLTEVGVDEVRNEACERLLAQRIEVKMKGRRVHDVLNRLHMAVPQPRDGKERPPFIPDGVEPKQPFVYFFVQSVDRLRKKLARELELELGDEYMLNLQEHWQLRSDEWKSDVIPEIMDGKNIADFIDPEIMQRLEELEAEEDRREAAGEYVVDPADPAAAAARQAAMTVRAKRKVLAMNARLRKSKNASIMPRKGFALQAARAEAKEAAGDDDDYEDVDGDDDAMEVDGERGRSVSSSRAAKRARAASPSATPGSRSLSRSRAELSLNPEGQAKAQRMSHVAQRPANRSGRAGEADRHVHCTKPRHLFAGKRKAGKTDRR